MNRKIFISAMVLLVCALGGAAFFFFSGPRDYAVTEFRDGFEYTDSPVNHGWRYIFPGASDSVLFTTTERAQSGKRSMKGFWQAPPQYTRFGLEYSFEESDFGKPLAPEDSFELIVHWYDDGTQETNSCFHPNITYVDHKGVTRSVLFSETREKYSYSPKQGSSWAYDSFAPRKKGWHQIRFVVRNNSIDLYFDGKLIAESYQDVDKMVCFHWASNIISPEQYALAWLDNVTFTRKTKLLKK